MNITTRMNALERILSGLKILGVKVADNTPKTEGIDLTNPDKIPATAILQNRDRSSKSSVFQMKQIAANPDYDRLSGSKSFGNGAPVVAYGNIPATQKGAVTKAVMPDGERFTVQYAVVNATEVLTSNDVNGGVRKEYFSDDPGEVRAIAGNGRITGVAQAYRDGKADGYKAALMQDASQYGLSRDLIEKMPSPVLVRVMQAKDVTGDIGDRSNQITSLSMNAVETANNDKNRIDFSRVKTYEDGSLTMESLAEFVAQMPDNEKQGLIDEDGRPTRQAEERADAAVFAKAYENDALTRLKSQALEPEAKSIINGLSMAAPAIAKLAGLGDGYDVRDLIVQAATRAVNAIRSKQRLSDAAAQTSFIGDAEDNAAAGEILKMFSEYRRSARTIADKLSKMADSLYQEGMSALQGASLFGDELAVSRQELIKNALVLDGIKMSSAGAVMWNFGGDAMRWLLNGQGEKPQAFFDSLREIATREYY